MDMGAEGVAVVGLGEADELVSFFGVADVEPVLGGEFEGDFGGGGAAVAVEDFLQVLRNEFHQTIGQKNRRFVREAEQGGVGDFFELGLDGVVDFGDLMAVDVAPEGGDAVEVAAAVGVDEVHAVGVCDDQGSESSQRDIGVKGCQMCFLSSC